MSQRKQQLEKVGDTKILQEFVAKRYHYLKYNPDNDAVQITLPSHVAVAEKVYITIKQLLNFSKKQTPHSKMVSVL
jgi:hypothetical protein